MLEIVTKQADADGDGWVEYDEFCDVILHNKEQIKPTHLQGLEKVRTSVYVCVRMYARACE